MNFSGFRARSPARVRLHRHRPPLLQRQHGRRRRRSLRHDRHQARLPEDVRPGRTGLRALPPRGQRPRARRAPAGLPARRPRTQVGVGQAVLSDRKELLRIFGRYTETDIHERRDPAPAQARLRSAKSPDPRGPLPGRDRARHGDSYVIDHRRQPAKTVAEFLKRAVLEGPARESRRRDAEDLGPSSTSPGRSRRKVERSAALAPGSRRPRPRARTASRDATKAVDFPVYYPAVARTPAR